MQSLHFSRAWKAMLGLALLAIFITGCENSPLITNPSVEFPDEDILLTPDPSVSVRKVDSDSGTSYVMYAVTIRSGIDSATLQDAEMEDWAASRDSSPAELSITYQLGVGLNGTSAVKDTVVGTSRFIGLTSGDPTAFEESFVADEYEWTFPSSLTVYVFIENPRNQSSIGATESVTASMNAAVTVNYTREGKGLDYEVVGDALETVEYPF